MIDFHLNEKPDFPTIAINIRAAKEVHLLNRDGFELAATPITWQKTEKQWKADIKGYTHTEGQPTKVWLTGAEGHPRIMEFEAGPEEDDGLQVGRVTKGTSFKLTLSFPRPLLLPSRNEKPKEAPDTKNLSEETATDLVRWLIDQVGYAAVTRALIDAQNPKPEP